MKADSRIPIHNTGRWFAPSAIRLVLGLVAAVALGAWYARSQAPLNQREIMRQKLEQAQAVLAGIATENFSLVATNARHLAHLSQQAAWDSLRTDEYQRFTSDFRRHAEALAAAADRRNVDAATIAYFQLTATCVECHKYLRRSRLAALPAPDDAPALARAR